MRNDYRIFQENTYDFSRCTNYDICYRLIICHALHHLKNLNDVETAKNLFNELYENFKKCEQYPLDIKSDNNFLFLFPLTMKNSSESKTGYVLVDKSRGIYPMVLYPYKSDENASERVYALENAIEDIKNKLGQITSLLNDHSEWSADLQNKLHDIFSEKAV